MKKLLTLLLSLGLVFSLAACGGDEETTPVDNNTTDTTDTTDSTDTTPVQLYADSEDYFGLYSTHYETLNYLFSNFQGDNQYTANFVDGLVETDKYGRIEPALAESWEVIDNADGTQTWRFDLREGVYWVDSEGTKYKEVVADDWVAAAEWILNPSNASEVFSLMVTFIDGAGDYYDGTTSDFSTVGVSAPSKYVLEYTLPQATPYFLTALTYNVFYPVNREYLENAGSMFGLDGDYILYNGAYLMDQDELDAIISMKVNPEYWDPASQNIRHITFYYQPADVSVDFARLKYENGEINSFTLTENDLSGWEKYVTGECYGSACEGSLINPIDPRVAVEDSIGDATYTISFNFARNDFDLSLIDDEDVRTATNLAINNVDFRLGFLYGLERERFTAYWNPDNPAQWVRNTYMFEDLALDENGVDYMDHYYQVFADKQGVTFEEAAAMNADSQNGFYDFDAAVASFEAAKAALIADGLTEADFPIQVEAPMVANTNQLPYLQEMVDAFNTSFGEYVELVPNYPAGTDQFYDMVYYQEDYDIKFWWAGWGPDYADPHTFMGTYIINGDTVSHAGFDGTNDDVMEEVLGHYTDLVMAAAELTDADNLSARFDAYALAEYNLIWEDVLLIPLLATSGKSIFVSNLQPYTAMRAPYGLSSEKFKDRIILSEPLTREERAEARTTWEAEKAALVG